MKFLITTFFSLCFFITAYSQVGQKFPTVETETILGEVVTFPGQFSGKYTMIGIGTSKQAEDQLRGWQNPLYQKFVAKTGLMDDMFNVNLCFLPLFTGASQMAKGKVVKKLKENNEPLVMNNVYIYAGSRDPFTNIGISDKSEPYFLLLNDAGMIVWSASGSFKQRYLDEVEAILTR